MMLASKATRDCYAALISAITVAGRLRVRALYAIFPDEPKKLLSSRLRQMERLGYVAREDVCVNGRGGRLYRLGATSLPPFNADAARAVYEGARSMYQLLARHGDAGATSPQLHQSCGVPGHLAITASRLMAWERAGKVRCDRDVRPQRWFALLPDLPAFDAMVDGEARRRAAQGAMPEALAASLRVAARARLRRENEAIDRMAAKMPVAPWLAPLVKKHPRATSWGVV